MAAHNLTPDHVLSAIQAEIDAGHRHADIAGRHGIHANTVSKLLRSGRLTPKSKAGSPKVVKRMSSRGILPGWLPLDLRSEYFDNAQLYGEEHAARLARAAKAEASRMGA